MSTSGDTIGSAWSIAAYSRSPTGGMNNGRSPCSTPKPTLTSISPCSKKSRPRFQRRNGSVASHLSVRPDTNLHQEEIQEKASLANEVITKPAAQEAPHLRRVLGKRDLVLLFVVAVFNLNVVPSIAANGGVTVWLWMISLILFFWPQGIAVIELAHRYPGEGGVYLWAKEVFGDFHGFLSGWCYWTNNMMYVPTVMLYFVGVSVFVLGPSHAGLADDKSFALWTSVILLLVLAGFNIVGLGVGKWINNLGAIGTGIAATVLIVLGLIVVSKNGITVTAADFQFPHEMRFVLNTF